MSNYENPMLVLVGAIDNIVLDLGKNMANGDRLDDNTSHVEQSVLDID